MAIKYILFDLDGTITDSKPGITRSAAYALSFFGYNEDPESLGKFVGPPLKDSFRVYYGMDDEQVKVCLDKFHDYFEEKGIYENSVFDGAEEMLARLQNDGYSLMIASSKPERFAKQVISNFGLERYFDLIVGGNMDGTRTEKDEVIKYIITEKGLDPAGIVMVGDRKFDVEGAHLFGIKAIGVLYGYGGYGELTEAGADMLAQTPEDVVKTIERL